MLSRLKRRHYDIEVKLIRDGRDNNIARIDCRYDIPIQTGLRLIAVLRISAKSLTRKGLRPHGRLLELLDRTPVLGDNGYRTDPTFALQVKQ
jgi:hypothetical protein